MKTKAYFHALLVLTLILGGFAGCSKKAARSDAQIASASKASSTAIR